MEESGRDQKQRVASRRGSTRGSEAPVEIVRNGKIGMRGAAGEIHRAGSGAEGGGSDRAVAASRAAARRQGGAPASKRLVEELA